MATGPINYAVGMPDLTSQFSNFNVALSGYMDRDKALRDEAEKKAKEEAFATRLKEVLSSGDQRALLDLQIENPDKFEFARGAWNQLKDDEKKAQFGKLSEVRTALRTAPEVGVRMIRDHVTALENSGQDSSQFKELLRVAEIDPEAAAQSFEMLMTVADPDAVKKIYDTEGVKTKAALDAAKAERDAALLPHEIAYKQAMAGKATQDMLSAPEKIQLDRDRLALQEQQARDTAAARHDAAETRKTTAEAANAARLTTTLNSKNRFIETNRQAIADVDKATSVASNSLKTIEAGQNNLGSVAGNIVIGWTPPPPDGKRPQGWPPRSAITKTAKNAFGPVEAMLPTLRDATAALTGQLETIISQATLEQLPLMKGFGSLAVAEMKTLADSVANLNPNMPPEQLARELDKVYLKFESIKSALLADIAKAKEQKREALRLRDQGVQQYDAVSASLAKSANLNLPGVRGATQAQPAAPAVPQTKSYAKYAQPAAQAAAPGQASSADPDAWMF